MSDTTHEHQIDVGGGEIPVTTEDLKLFETSTEKPVPPAGNEDRGSSSTADVKPEHRAAGRETEEGDDERFNQSQNRLRRERQRLARQRSEQELTQLRGEVAQLREMVARGHVNSIDAATTSLEAQFNQVRERFQRAERLHAQAITDGNGAAAVQALADRDAALEEARRIDAQRGQAQQARQQMTQPRRQEPPQQPVVDPVIADHGLNFMQDHPWYNLQGTDADSVAVSLIDSQLSAEGYDPRSEAYWQELRERTKERVPHRFQRPVATNGNGARRGPPVSGPGGNASGTRPEASPLTPARIEAMKQAGVWDNKEARDRMIARYREYDSQQGAR